MLSPRQTEQIPVTIQIKTVIQQGNDTETYKLTAFGSYQQTATAVYLRYEEEMDVGNVKTTVKVSDTETLILRNGAVKMRMVLRPGIEVSGTYHSPHGIMETIITTHKIDHSFNQQTNQGIINLTYDLSMQGTLAGTYHLEIKFKEEQV